MPFHSISISINTNLLFIIIGSLLLTTYSFYIYRFTIPQVSNFLRLFLITIRSLIIILILLLLFEPVITFIQKEKIEPKIQVFIDNSSSISSQDSSKRFEQIKQIISEINNIGVDNTVLFTFGSKIRQLNFDDIDSIKLNEPLTNFSIPVTHLRNSNENIAASVFISDGIITDGIDPIYEIEKLKFPVFTIGVGDTTLHKDISIKDVLFNRFIYTGKTTEIEAVISQFGFSNQIIEVSLYDENIHIQTNEISLNPEGINRVRFEYTPVFSGERKMFISIQPKKDEHIYENNRKPFFINVLDDKVKIGILAGTPSPDLSSILGILEENENLKITKLIQISKDKYWNEEKSSAVIDSSDLLFLIDFPNLNTKRELIEKLISVIESTNKPFFITISPYGNLAAIKNIERIIPFTIGRITDDIIQTEADISGTTLSLVFSQSVARNNIWSSLPPLSKYSAELLPKPGSNLLIKARLRNNILSSPVLFSRNIGNQMSIALLAGDIWRWRLGSSERNPEFFPSLINDIVRWLSSFGKEKQFIVSTSKKIFSQGENVEFTAELYDQTFTPIDSANIELTIFKDETSYKLSFEKLHNGLFRAILDAPLTGDFSYKAEAQFNGNKLESNIGRFSVGDTEIEKQITRMDRNFLENIAQSSNGKFAFAENFDSVTDELQLIFNNSVKDKLSYTEINLWSNHWIMFVIICLFVVEWFIRKRNGML